MKLIHIRVYTLTRLLIVAVLANSHLNCTQANEPFTLVVLPDTQNYTEDPANRHVFSQQTEWIQTQIQDDGNPRNIQFVSHVGDVVNHGGSSTQWSVAGDAMSNLSEVVKFSVLPGNHDYSIGNSKESGTTLYLDHFGPANFQGESWYRGADPSGKNSFQRFSAGGYDFLHLALEWRPTENIPYQATSPIEWAQSVLNANPDVPVILTTHENLIDIPGQRSQHGEYLWDQFVRGNDQIFMVLSGHYQAGHGFNDGEFHQVSYNDAGRPVFELLQNFQDYPNGGDGWLRLYNFDFPNDQIAVETYSPRLDAFQTETIAQVGQHASQFELEFDFASRLNPIATPATPDLIFREGAGYFGTVDTEIRSNGSGSFLGNNATIDIASSSSSQTQALIRFDNIIGSAANQIQQTARIESAKLVLSKSSSLSHVSIHELLTDWQDTSSWAELVNGIQPDGVEAAIAPIATIGALTSEQNQGSRVEIDVTSSIQAYLAGDQENLGWVLAPNSNLSEASFRSSEYYQSSGRPMLEIYLAEPNDGDFDSDHVVTGGDFLAWQRGQSQTQLGLSDLLEWQAVYGTASSASQAARTLRIPEPSSFVLLQLFALSWITPYSRVIQLAN